MRTYYGDGFLSAIYLTNKYSISILHANSYTATELNWTLQNMTSDGFFSDNNLAIIITFSMYMPDLDMWVFNYAVI